MILSFWEIALPVMAAVIPLFMWPDLARMYHYVKKRWMAQKVQKVCSDKENQCSNVTKEDVCLEHCEHHEEEAVRTRTAERKT